MGATRTLHLFAFAVLAVAAAPTLHAAPCVGFTDVEDTSVFCRNVEWLKNRSITLGCINATTYCPNDPVTRVQMALFLQRAGNATTPTTIAGYNSGSFLDIDLSPVLCPTGLYTAPFSKIAHGVGLVLAWTFAADTMNVTITPVSRPNASAPWTPTAGNPSTWTATGNAAQMDGRVLFPPQPLAPGETHQWGLQVSRAGITPGGDFAGWNCQILIDVENRVTTSSPFDDDEE